jgi:hypothetical protein
VRLLPTFEGITELPRTRATSQHKRLSLRRADAPDADERTFTLCTLRGIVVK